MRVAYVVTEYVTEPNFAGGLANYTYRIAQSMLKRGHVPEIFVSSDRDDSFIHDEIMVHRIQTKIPYWLRLIGIIQRRLFSNRYNADVIITAKVISLQKFLNYCHQKNPFDVVHYTHLSATGILRQNLPSIVRLSSYADLLVPFGFQFTSRYQRWAENLALKRADAVICPSEYVAKYVEKSLGIKVDVIESPYILEASIEEDDSILQSLLSKEKFPEKFGLYYGSLSEWKGIFSLVDALPYVLNKYPEFGFVFIGRDLSFREGMPASDYIRKKLSVFRNRIFIHSPLQHFQLYPFIRKALFVALPSLADNLPNTCIESMWMRKVVIGTNGRSFDQLIQHRNNGLLCEPGDVGSLAGCMDVAINFSSLERKTIGDLAHMRIEMLSPDIISKKIEEYYQNVLAGNR